jgi:hypothetical protein
MPNHDLELACWLATTKRIFLRSAAFQILSRSKRKASLVLALMMRSDLSASSAKN